MGGKENVLERKSREKSFSNKGVLCGTEFCRRNKGNPGKQLGPDFGNQKVVVDLGKF